MNGLNASRGLVSSATTESSLQLKLMGTKYNNTNDTDSSIGGDNEDDESLEDVTNDIKNLSTISEEENDISEDDSDDTTQQKVDRDVVTFFRQYISVEEGNKQPPLQPMSVLQARYNTLQQKIAKQANVKSIKGWFEDTKYGEAHKPWFTSVVVIPYDIVSMWRLQSSISSGQFQLTSSEAESLQKAFNGRDLLFDICGEYRVSSESSNNTIEFKSKKGAQKSAALNLLMSLDIGEQHINANDVQQPVLQEASITSTPKARFQLQSIRYYGAVNHPEGDFLSLDNPCLMQCTLSVICNDENQEDIEVTSTFHRNEHESLNDVSEQLMLRLQEYDATVDDTNNILSSMRKNKPNISYEKTLPRWAMAKLETKLYIYELQFVVCKNGKEIPLSEVVGLDASLATRIGIICGRQRNLTRI